MWEKCVGCGEGLFAGDAFCGNCGRPATPAVPAAREPGGLESPRRAASPTRAAAQAADLAEVHILPAGHATAAAEHAAPGQVLAASGTTAADYAASPDDRAQPNGTARPDGSHRPDGTGQPHGAPQYHGTIRRNSTARHAGLDHGDGAVPAEDAPGLAITEQPCPGSGASAPPVVTRLSGPANLDPVRNARYLMSVLRQATMFAGIYLLIETALLLCLLISTAAGTKPGAALALETDSLWPVALVLIIVFWLIPVPALLAEWSLLMEQSSDAAQKAFEHINSAFHAHGIPLDSQRVQKVSWSGVGDREYLELRRDHFSGYISCFAQGSDLYVGWTFWLRMSPLRLLMMAIGRNIRDMTSRGDAIHCSLRFESTRALVAAMHGATLAGIDAASGQCDPDGPRLLRETAIDMNSRLG